jgi:hypothetical protein
LRSQVGHRHRGTGMTHAQLLAAAAHTVASSYRDYVLETYANACDCCTPEELIQVTNTIWIRADKVAAFKRQKG